MIHYKLQYFPFRDFGEPIRLIFHYLNIPFEDEVISFEDWPKYKPKTPYGHLPILFIDGKPLVESRSICRYLAKIYNLGGKDPYEQERLNSIGDFLMDFFLSIRPYVLTKRGFKTYKDAFDQKLSIHEELHDLQQKYFNELWVPYCRQDLPVFVKLLKESGSGFFSNEGVTWVDFYVADIIFTLNSIEPDTFKNYPEIVEHMKKVYSLPQIKDYVATRKN